ncbi:MAG: Hsp70 family protein, partial [Cyanobacteriota bacterium]
ARLLEPVLAAGGAVGVALAEVTAVLRVGGGRRLPLIQTWLQERCPGLMIRAERPIEAVVLGALALTPGVAIKDVLSRGVSLRCWDRRLGGHRWHPLFLPGQSWPTAQPLELVLACSEAGQTAVELVLGEPDADQRHEVIYCDGVPMLRPRPAGENAVTPWPAPAISLPLQSPGDAGEDRLRLLFAINDDAELTVEWQELNGPASGPTEQPRKPLLALGMVR